MAVPRTIRFGATGPEVVALQQKLALPVAKLGTFDAFTEQAVKNYQRSVGITPDGIVGPITWSRLGVTNVAAPAPIIPSGLPTIGPLGLPNFDTSPSSPTNNPNVVPRGTRVLLKGTVQNVFGGSAAIVFSSALNKLAAAMQNRAYGNIQVSGDWLGGGVQLAATVNADKANLEAIRDIDFIGAGKDAGLPIGNAQIFVNPTAASPTDWTTYLLLGGAALLLFAVLRD